MHPWHCHSAVTIWWSFPLTIWQLWNGTCHGVWEAEEKQSFIILKLSRILLLAQGIYHGPWALEVFKRNIKGNAQQRKLLFPFPLSVCDIFKEKIINVRSPWIFLSDIVYFYFWLSLNFLKKSAKQPLVQRDHPCESHESSVCFILLWGLWGYKSTGIRAGNWITAPTQINANCLWYLH